MSQKQQELRASRESQTHDKKARRQEWRPRRKLDAPPARDGYVQRWIRESMLGQEDRSNVASRIREGWELKKPEDLPDGWDFPTLESGNHAGVVYSDGLLLAEIPEEIVEQRNDYYEQKNRDAQNALDNTMFNEMKNDGRYVKYDPQRDTRVTFGKK